MQGKLPPGAERKIQKRYVYDEYEHVIVLNSLEVSHNVGGAGAQRISLQITSDFIGLIRRSHARSTETTP